MPAGDPGKKHLTFLVTAQGKPFTAAGFGNWFRDACREAKLPERCTSHGLRKAAATYLAEQGATEHQLMAWFGWSSISQAQVYTKAANRRRMAQSAGKLISGTGIGSPIDPVSRILTSAAWWSFREKPGQRYRKCNLDHRPSLDIYGAELGILGVRRGGLWLDAPRRTGGDHLFPNGGGILRLCSIKHFSSRNSRHDRPFDLT